MDGPQIGSGGGVEIASAYVSIIGDTSGLRAAEEEAKQIMARLGAMGGGTIGNPGSGGSMGGITIAAKIDESGLRQQIDGFFRGLSIRLPVELDIKGGDRLAGGGASTFLGEPLTRMQPSGVIASNPQVDLHSPNAPVISPPAISIAQPSVSIMQSAPPAALMPTPESRAAVVASAVEQTTRGGAVHLAGGQAVPTNPAVDFRLPIERVAPPQVFPPDVVSAGFAKPGQIAPSTVTIAPPVPNSLAPALPTDDGARKPRNLSAGAQGKIDFSGAFGVTRDDVTHSIAAPIWEKVKSGESIARIGPIENKFRDLQKAGKLNSFDDVWDVVEAHRAQLEGKAAAPITAPVVPIAKGPTVNTILSDYDKENASLQRTDLSLPVQKIQTDQPITSPATSPLAQDFARLERPITNVAVSARADQEALYEQAKRAGVANEIASQYVVEKRKPIDIPHPPEVIEAVRNKLGIPSQFEPAEFHEFRQRVMNEAAGPLAVDPVKSTWMHSPTEIHPSESRWLNAPARGSTPPPENPIHGGDGPQVSHQLGAAAQALLNAANAIGSAAKGAQRGVRPQAPGRTAAAGGGAEEEENQEQDAPQGRRGSGRQSPQSSLRRMARRFGAIWAVDEALQLGSGLMEASRIEDNPERITRQYNQIGSTFNAVDDPQLRAAGRGLAGASATQRRIQSFESLPLIGGVIGFGVSATGMKEGLADREYFGNRAFQMAEFSQKENEGTRLEQASLSGPIAEQDAKIAIERERLKTAEGGTAFVRSAIEADAQQRIRDSKFHSDVPDELKAAFYKSKDAEDAIRARIKLEDGEKRDTIQLQHDVRIGQHESAGESARMFGEAMQVSSSRLPGSAMEALRLTQKGERENFDQKTYEMIAAVSPHDDATRNAIAGQRANESRTLDESQKAKAVEVARQMESELLGIQSQGDAARLAARGDTFGAELRKFEDHARELRERVRGTTITMADGSKRTGESIADESLKTQREAMMFAHQREVDNTWRMAGVNFGGSVLGVQAQYLQSHGDPHAAEMLAYQGRASQNLEQMRQAAQLPLPQAIPKLMTLFGQGLETAAERAAKEENYRRDFAEQGFDLETRSRIATDRTKDEPLAAHAEGVVGSARMEYEKLTRATRDPARLKLARDTISKELEADRHEMFGQRGGEVAIDMSLANATAIPAGLDLSGRQRDQKLAGAVLDKGIADIRAGRPIAPAAVNAPGAGAMAGPADAVLQSAQQAITQFMAAVTKFAGAKGVAMFGV